jgi:carboxyl-terminal processing protease
VKQVKSRKTVIVLLIVVAVAASYLTYHFTMLRYQNVFQMGREELSDLEDFFYVYEYARDQFVDEVPPSQLLEGAMAGLLDALGDPYTSYLNEDQYQRLLQETGGSFGGVGVYVGIRDNQIVIIAPIEGTPGAEAGLLRGDQILAVDGNDTENMTLDDIVELMRGEVGTTVELSVLREGESIPRSFRIRRALIAIESVKAKVVEDGIGYISVTEFNRSTSADFAEALRTLRSQDIRGLIVDLRDNPGGVLSDSIELAEMLVEPGPVVHIVDRSGIRDTKSSNTPGLGIPLVVLINGGSASASEIVAGAVKDRNAGILVGAQTFGKASVQGIFGLFSGAGFKITTDRYLTPNGTLIHEVGVAPDEWVYELGDRNLVLGDAGQDVRKLAAVLKDLGYHPDEPNDVFGDQLQKAVQAFQLKIGVEEDGTVSRALAYRILEQWFNTFPDVVIPDLQLERALNILRNQ